MIGMNAVLDVPNGTGNIHFVTTSRGEGHVIFVEGMVPHLCTWLKVHDQGLLLIFDPLAYGNGKVIGIDVFIGVAGILSRIKPGPHPEVYQTIVVALGKQSFQVSDIKDDAFLGDRTSRFIF